MKDICIPLYKQYVSGLFIIFKDALVRLHVLSCNCWKTHSGTARSKVSTASTYTISWGVIYCLESKFTSCFSVKVPKFIAMYFRLRSRFNTRYFFNHKASGDFHLFALWVLENLWQQRAAKCTTPRVGHILREQPQHYWDREIPQNFRIPLLLVWGAPPIFL